jgi:hypothetical protein
MSDIPPPTFRSVVADAIAQAEGFTETQRLLVKQVLDVRSGAALADIIDALDACYADKAALHAAFREHGLIGEDY